MTIIYGNVSSSLNSSLNDTKYYHIIVVMLVDDEILGYDDDLGKAFSGFILSFVI